MQTFKINSLDNWAHILGGEVLELLRGERRQVKIEFNTTARIAVYVSSSPDMSGRKLLASADGMFSVDFTASGATYVQAESRDGAVVYFRTQDRTQVIEARDEPTFTDVEPRGRRNSEYDRMMMLMKHNERRRDAALELELARIRAANVQPAPKVIEPDPAPAEPDPAPAEPEPAPAET